MKTAEKLMSPSRFIMLSFFPKLISSGTGFSGSRVSQEECTEMLCGSPRRRKFDETMRVSLMGTLTEEE